MDIIVPMMINSLFMSFRMSHVLLKVYRFIVHPMLFTGLNNTVIQSFFGIAMTEVCLGFNVNYLELFRA